MSRRDQALLIAANVAARLVVYGPLMAAAALFMPAALPVLLLSAAQPWTTQGAQLLGQWLDRHVPVVMKPVNWALDKWGGKIGGHAWWTHTGVIIGMIAAAVVPVPAVLHLVFGKLPGFITGMVGGAQGAWSQVLPLALVTALPLATKLATTGFDWVFRHVGLAEVLVRRDADRAARLAARELAAQQAAEQEAAGRTAAGKEQGGPEAGEPGTPGVPPAGPAPSGLRPLVRSRAPGMSGVPRLSVPAAGRRAPAEREIG